MCLSRKKELDREQQDGFKVLIKQGDGYHAIKNDLDRGALKENKQHTAIDEGFNIFYDKDNAKEFKDFLINLLDNSKDSSVLNRDGEPVIKEIKGKDIFLQGRQPISRDEIFEDNSDRQFNAFKCKTITIQ